MAISDLFPPRRGGVFSAAGQISLDAFARRQLLFLYVLETGVCAAVDIVDGSGLLHRASNGKNRESA